MINKGLNKRRVTKIKYVFVLLTYDFQKSHLENLFSALEIGSRI